MSLATCMQRRGIPVFVASPAGWGESSRLRIPHFRIGRLRIFGRTFLFSSDDFRAGVRSENPRVYAIDRAAARLARARKLDIANGDVEFGIDLSVFNPQSVSTLRQTRFLSEFNIAPHQKLVTVVSPPGLNLDALIRAMKIVDSSDLVVAIFGISDKSVAARLVGKIEKSGRHIICTSPDSDAATVLRSSYAVLSLGAADPALMMAALAVGRPAIWSENECGINPNIALESAASPESIAAALDVALALNASEREKIGRRNTAAASEFDVDSAIRKLVGAGC